MAINHTTFFTKMGRLVAKANSLETLQTTTFPADLQAIVAAFGTSNTGSTTSQDPIDGINNDYQRLMDQIGSVRRRISTYADNLMVDRDTVVDQLAGLSNTSRAAVLTAFIQDMIDQAQTVVSSTVTIGSVSAASLNIGNGTVVLDKVLDGYQAPVRGGLSHIRYMDLNSEMAPPSVTHAFTCTSDSYRGGTAGGETFSWTDGVETGVFDIYANEGIGQGPSLTVAGTNSTNSGGDFETWSGNTPSSWTIALGTAGVNVFKESTTVYRGTYSMKLTGTGAVPTISLTQSLARRLSPRRRYMAHVYLRKDGSPVSGNFKIILAGTGYTDTVIDVAASGLSSSAWALFTGHVTIPANPPANMTMYVQAAGGLTPGTSILVDSVHLTPVSYHGGISAVVVPGSTPWVNGDKLTATVTNSEGVFQRFFRRWFKCQLPSATTGTSSYGAVGLPFALFTAAGSTTISDALAT